MVLYLKKINAKNRNLRVGVIVTLRETVLIRDLIRVFLST